MADYPNTPQYGGLPYTQWPPAPPSQTQQHQPPPSSASFSSFPPSSTAGYAANLANSGTFDANARIPGLGGILAPPPPPLAPELLKQFASSPLPPPPFPPVTIPQVGLPSIPGLGADPSLSARRSPIETAYQPPEPTPHVLEAIAQVQPEVNASREEGELSDGELEEDSIHSQGAKSNSAQMGNAISKSGNAPSEPSLSDDEGSVSSYNPPSASSIEHIDTPQSGLMSNPQIASHPSNTTLADLKTQAKGAILSLVPHNITFQDLVDEGIDESVLRQLFQEVGIKDTVTANKQVVSGLAVAAKQDLSTSAITKPADGSEQSVASAASKPVPSQVTTVPESNAAVERKDRIAQLLALKAANKNPKSQSNNQQPTGHKVPISTSLTHSLPSIPPKPSDAAQEQTAKKKNKAQTDLVRAKMEALKQQALAKQAQKNASPAPTFQTNSTLPSTLSGPATNGKSSQKRPLASDLFEEASPASKRPFGRKESNEQVEIVLSDEEGEISDVGMDLDGSSDSSHREHSTSGAPAHHVSSPLQAGISPLMSTSGTPSREKNQDDLWKAKNEEIARMRKHIAELEQRRKTKQNLIEQGQSPSPSTPGSLLNATPGAVLTTPTKYLVQPESPAGTPPINAAARAEALRKRLIRRREIQAGIPLIDAEVERTRSRLAEIHKEAQRLEEEIQKGLEGRQKLLRELELLGVDSEVVPLERMRLPELRAVRDELLEAQQQGTTSQIPTTTEKDASAPLQTLEEITQRDTETTPAIANNVDTMVNETEAVKPVNGDITLHTDVTDETNKAQQVEQLADDTILDDGESVGSAMDESSSTSSEDELPEFPANNQSNISQNNTTIAPSIVAELPTLQEAIMPVVSKSPEEVAADPGSDDGSGSLSMSDSASENSEDYEPADVRMAESEDDAEDVPMEEGSSDDSDEEYEPMDVPHEIETETPTGGESASDEGSQSPVQDQEKAEELTEANIVSRPTEVTFPTQEISEPEDKKPTFGPYNSVLKDFRNYRFHPDFTNSVTGGYRSLTYSSKIDPRKVLCSAEARGEVCQDPKCEDQHFAEMGLPDDKILVEMSSAPNLDKDSRNKYVNGLKVVIADLRSRGVKEFEQVASELAAFRRRFEVEQDPLLAPPPMNGTASATSVE